MDIALRDEPAPQHVRLREQREEYRGPIFTIYNDEIEFASGEVTRRQYMEHDHAVGIVALRAGAQGEPEVLLIRQYRHPVRKMLWEIPAGLRDHADEDGLLAAQRELAEEADLQAAHWQQSVSYLSSPGCSTENLDIYIATGCTPVTRDAADNPAAGFEREYEEREIVTAWWPLAEVYQAVLRRDLRSPSLVLGVLAAQAALQAQPALLRS